MKKKRKVKYPTYIGIRIKMDTYVFIEKFSQKRETDVSETARYMLEDYIKTKGV